MFDSLDGAFGHWTQTFSIRKATNILDVSIDQVRQWIADGTLPSKRILGMTRISYRVLERACLGELLVCVNGRQGTTLDYLRIGEQFKETGRREAND